MSSIIKAKIVAADCLLIREPQVSLYEVGAAGAERAAGRSTDAMSILRKARRQAADLLAEAKLEAERVKDQAQAEGYAAGFKAGKEQGLREGAAEGRAAGWNSGLDKAQELVRQAEAVLTTAEEERRRLFADLENDVVALAFTIAEKIVQHHIEREDTYLVEVLASALQQLDTKGKVIVRVHAERLEQVITSNKLRQLADALEVLPDDTLSLGDWLLETEAGVVDGRLATRFGDVQAALESVVGA